jgi:hypothetical protein
MEVEAKATNVEDAKELAATIFKYITTIDGIRIFRKPKMFEKYMYQIPGAKEKVYNNTKVATSPAQSLLLYFS